MSRRSEDRYQGQCEWCGRRMFMPPHGWPGRRGRRWCSRDCRNAGNRAERRAERLAAER